MFKITLFDAINCGFCTGVATFFTENLDDFEKHWLKLIDDDLKDRYFRSKAGEIVTDYYSDSPDLNIVQCDDECEIIDIKKFVYHDKLIRLLNLYYCERFIYANEINIELAYIKYDSKYFLIGKYKLLGTGEKSFFSNNNSNTYRPLRTFGNEIFTYKISDEFIKRYNDYIELIEQNIKELENVNTLEAKEQLRKLNSRIFKTENMSDFKGYDIETYCWITVDEYENKEDLDLKSMTDISDDMLIILMRDILGESG